MPPNASKKNPPGKHRGHGDQRAGGVYSVSDKTQQENFKSVDGGKVLWKIRGLELSSWNFIGHDPKKFRHYGPMAQDFFAASATTT
jgi:hypothetical protein